MTTEEALKHDPTLTEEQAEGLAAAVNRYVPCVAEAEIEEEAWQN